MLTTWTGYYAPKGTPAETVQKINADLRRVAAIPQVKVRLDETGWTPKLMSPEEFGAFVKGEIERWGVIIKKYGIKLEQ